MIQYLVKRALIFFPMALFLMLLVFAIMDFTPGDPARLILGERATESQLQIMREELGLNRPFLLRYGQYVYRLAVKQDWGRSYSTRASVLSEIIRKFPYTLRLATLAVLGSAFLGLSLGMLSATRPHSRFDRIASSLSIGIASIPGFWLGMLLMLFFSLHLRVLPSNGASSWAHYILPSLALLIPGSGSILRLTRTMMIDALEQDYINTARAKGAGEGSVVFMHALKNAAPPLLTNIGMHFGYLLGGAVITETVFAIPGLGSHIIDAIRMKDTPVVLGSTLFISLFYYLVLTLIDIGCAMLDPRIRYTR